MISPSAFFTLSHFLDLCLSSGLSVGSKPTYLKYERLGVFLPGHASVTYVHRIERLFTQEEMLTNIERYKQWKRGTLQTK
jgi:hypothetical protein